MRPATEIRRPVQLTEIRSYTLADDGIFPNNETLAVLLYKNVLRLTGNHDEKQVKHVFEENGWSNAWTDGIYDYDHYHSITHEVLGVVRGEAHVQLGGASGVTILLEKGDVLAIPAGVAHKKIGGTDDFACVGAYPEGRDYDMNYGKESERPKADENIRALPVPGADPVYGKEGPLTRRWKHVEGVMSV